MQTFERNRARRRMDIGHAPMRVLRIATRLNVGGPARQILALEPALARRGVHGLLVSGVCDETEADLAELLDYEGLRRIHSMGREPSLRGDARSLELLHRTIRRFRPDIVHTHMAKAGALGRVAALIGRVPVRVHTYHGHTLDGYFSPTARTRVVFVERQLARISSALVAVSHKVADDLVREGIGRRRQFRVLSPGLDLTPFTDLLSDGALRRDLGIGPADPVIGFVARLVPVKSVDLMLESTLALLERVPNSHLVIAGDGPDMSLVRAARRHLPEVGRRIHAIAWVADMARFYAAMDIVVLTSKNEGTPISLIEAGAAGVPVVATRVGGVPEVVEDERTGLLVPAGNPDALTNSLMRLVGSPRLRAALGAEARRRSDRFSAERLADDTMNLYRQLFTRRPPREPRPSVG